MSLRVLLLKSDTTVLEPHTHLFCFLIFPATTWCIMGTPISCVRPRPWVITSSLEYTQIVRLTPSDFHILILFITTVSVELTLSYCPAVSVFFPVTVQRLPFIWGVVGPPPLQDFFFCIFFSSPSMTCQESSVLCRCRVVVKTMQ